MRIMIVGDARETPALVAELEAAGIVVDRRADDVPAPDGSGEIAAIARDLREFEGELGAGRVEAAIVASRSSASLAAVIVATKLGTPVACLDRPAGEGEGGSDDRLIRQLADTSLAPEVPGIVDWLRGGYPDRA